MENAGITGVIGYIVFYREKAMTSSPYKVMSSTNTTLVIAGLHPGTSYNLRLLAYTENGNGVSSKPFENSTKETGTYGKKDFKIVN